MLLVTRIAQVSKWLFSTKRKPQISTLLRRRQPVVRAKCTFSDPFGRGLRRWPLAGVYFSEKRSGAAPMVKNSCCQMGFSIQSEPSWRGKFIIQDKDLEMTSRNQFMRKGIEAQRHYVFGPSSHCSQDKTKQSRSPLLISFLSVPLETCSHVHLTRLVFV